MLATCLLQAAERLAFQRCGSLLIRRTIIARSRDNARPMSRYHPGARTRPPRTSRPGSHPFGTPTHPGIGVRFTPLRAAEIFLATYRSRVTVGCVALHAVVILDAVLVGGANFFTGLAEWHK